MDELIRKTDAIYAVNDVLAEYIPTFRPWRERIPLECALKIKALPTVQPEREQMYKKAFSVACELLIGANLFGVTEETMFTEIMEKDGIVSSLGYERYILDNLERLTGEDDGTD